jgi:hypothetical protein
MGKATRSLGATVRPIGVAYRARIKKRYLSLYGPGPLNNERRAFLEQVVFDEQNDLEHRSPKHPQVQIMNDIRNVLLDDLGTGGERGNTWERLRWPHVERMAEIIRFGKASF